MSIKKDEESFLDDESSENTVEYEVPPWHTKYKLFLIIGGYLFGMLVLTCACYTMFRIHRDRMFSGERSAEGDGAHREMAPSPRSRTRSMPPPSSPPGSPPPPSPPQPPMLTSPVLAPVSAPDFLSTPAITDPEIKESPRPPLTTTTSIAAGDDGLLRLVPVMQQGTTIQQAKQPVEDKKTLDTTAPITIIVKDGKDSLLENTPEPSPVVNETPLPTAPLEEVPTTPVVVPSETAPLNPPLAIVKEEEPSASLDAKKEESSVPLTVNKEESSVPSDVKEEEPLVSSDVKKEELSGPLTTNKEEPPVALDAESEKPSVSVPLRRKELSYVPPYRKEHKYNISPFTRENKYNMPPFVKEGKYLTPTPRKEEKYQRLSFFNRQRCITLEKLPLVVYTHERPLSLDGNEVKYTMPRIYTMSRVRRIDNPETITDVKFLVPKPEELYALTSAGVPAFNIIRAAIGVIVPDTKATSLEIVHTKPEKGSINCSLVLLYNLKSGETETSYIDYYDFSMDINWNIRVSTYNTRRLFEISGSTRAFKHCKLSPDEKTLTVWSTTTSANIDMDRFGKMKRAI